MVDIVISDGQWGRRVYLTFQKENIEYVQLNNLEKLEDKRIRFLHYCSPYNARFFYRLKQCIDISDKVQVIIIHNEAEYDSLINFQRLINIPIIYVPFDPIAGEPIIWHWSMIGEFADSLISEFTTMLEKTCIKNQHHKLIGL